MVYAEFGAQTECIMANWKIENTYSGVNFCEKNVCVNFFCGNLFLRIAGKIAKIRTRKNFVPHGISSLSELRLFC